MTRPVAFVLVASDHGPLIVNRLDVAQYPDGSLFGVGSQIFTKGHFDPEEIGACVELLTARRETHGDGVVALDVGANVGVFTLEFARELTGWGEVIAFEAQERLFYALAGNVALHNAFNARPVHAAVGSTTGKLLIPRPNYLKPASFGSLELKRRPGQTEYIGQTISYEEDDLDTVSVVSIDDLRLPRVDLIKVDVEGMELEVIAGARETISRCRPDLFVEWIKVGVAELTEALQPFDYALKVVEMNVVGTPL